ncbi:MAG TPA: sulfatase-like hydrolase/transferase [Terriglobales bacterium]|nr:sulfatase-like hydrolase/transferase [Terriglobales bacterium]
MFKPWFCLPTALLLLAASAIAANKPNIVLITLDSARADRMGFLGAKGGLTPNLDALAKQSIVFEHAYAQSPRTLASHAALLTGTYPPYNHAGDFGVPLASTLPYLPEALHAAGYRTAAFVGTITLDPRDGFAPGFDRGFDTYVAGFHPPRAGESRYQTVQRRGGDVTAQALEWLRRGGQPPFFLWLELNDAHAPYQPPAAYARAGTPYNGEIKYVDAQVGRVIAALRANGLYDGALVVVAADHGESLGAHGEETHGIFLYDETIHVPLLLKLPGNRAAKVSARVRLVDVAPTVLQTVGVPAPPQMQGQSLLREMRQAGMGEAAYSQSDYAREAFGWSRLEAWRAGKYLYVRSPKPELYDTEIDPGSEHNLAEKSRAIADTLSAQLLAFDEHMTGTAMNAGSAQLTSGELQKLASLGYVGLQKPASNRQTSVTGVDPKDQIAVSNRVEAAMREMEDGKPQRASAELQAVLKDHGNMFLAQFAAGMAAVERQRYASAVSFLRKAIELQPQAAWPYYEMGLALTHTGDWKGAATHLEIAVARLPEMMDAHARLAEAYQHLGRVAEAKKEQMRVQQLQATKARVSK